MAVARSASHDNDRYSNKYDNDNHNDDDNNNNDDNDDAEIKSHLEI